MSRCLTPWQSTCEDVTPLGRLMSGPAHRAGKRGHVSALHLDGDFSTVRPEFLLSFAIRRICSGNASLIGSIAPVSTIYLTYVFVNESILLLKIAGPTLVLIGVLIISVNRRHEGN